MEDLGYIYRCKWEHEFDKEVIENPDTKAFVDTLNFVTPLEPREAFFGGRTEAFTLFKEASDDDVIDYYDVTSLYPWVNKTGKVPLGHPHIVTENFEDIQNYEGLVKCRVLPPKGLYIPVLPYRSNGKLKFPLCRICADMKSQEPCRCRDEDRAFTGTWMTDEVKKAVEKGYEILVIFEVWHFERGGVFTEYVNTFLKMKQEASGWPDWCRTEEQKQQYIREYYETEGISLEYDDIKKNPGLRSLAKLMLNSFWGKLGQRSNMTQVTYVTEPSVYFDMLTSDEQEIQGVQFVGEEMVEIRWRNKDDFVVTSDKTNVVIAAYTTAQARLKLYSYLEHLGERVLYCDTDSVVFTSKPLEWKPPLGDYLGNLTDEAPDSRIITFVTGGPKNYAYSKTKNNIVTTCCKVRGITLNYRNALKIDFDTIRDMVKATIDRKDVRSVTVTDPSRICRGNRKIVSAVEHKDYRIVFDKRVMTGTPQTFPYGF
ncbi:hypothetical protein BOV88_13605 [Solemya velum gill symbiont]|uniref:DNA-directed DNA polymerase n=1 Tax=Solemya velum gill symbiont TaxID=2340 RepID=A0A1T2CFV2_SOVGS|nr:hypothetical protein BOV88_13605 [Solemya velum gill symbiont]